MTSMRFGRAQKVAALVPLAVVSALWTANVTGIGGTDATAADSPPAAPKTLPDGTPLPPAIGLDHPASVGTPATAIGAAKESQIVASADASGIPAAALAAYQRSASVIDQADTSCNLTWQLVAAIGRVESDHGRADGNTLTAAGVSTPGIFGPALDGRHGTRRIADTDSGQLDGDTTYDRAVGPMQFLPSTWQLVAVDADGDGQRNPQDINDAALATAVYLCSGDTDLSTPAAERQAVYRYNHSASYVATVLGVARAYLDGDYTSVPNSASIPFVFQPVPTPQATHRPAPVAHVKVSTPSAPASKPPATPKPSTPPAPTRPTPTAPAPSPTKAPAQQLGQSVQQVVASVTELAQVCTTALTQAGVSDPATAVPKALQECITELTGKTLPEAQQAVGGVVQGLAGLLQQLLGGVLGGLGGLLCGGTAGRG